VTETSGKILQVLAAFDGAVVGPLRVDDAAEPFVEGVEVAEGSGFRAVDRRDAGWSRGCAARCRVRYRFRLGDAAAGLADVDVALAAGGAIVAPPSTWLLRPEAPRGGQYRFHVSRSSGTGFVSGVRPAPAAGPDTYQADIADLDEAAFAAFGELRTLRIPGSGVEIAVAPQVRFADDVIARWIASEVFAITAYLGRAPEDRVVVFVVPGTSEVTRGKTLGGGGAAMLIRVGTGISEAGLGDDWVVAHELVHVAFPALGYEQGWFSEGLASYVEPIARARAGLLSPGKVWLDLVEGLPQGLPAAGDHGLAGSTEWGRVYWGGALYFLLADLEIREQTGGARTLGDAVRAVAQTGANVETFWPLERVLDAGDRATGTRVLHGLHTRLALAPGTEDLERLWARLGVLRDKGGVRFDDSAPLSGIRASITARPPPAGSPSVDPAGRATVPAPARGNR
jgi:hypothetical protein